MVAGTMKFYADQTEELLDDLNDRIAECKKHIENSKKGLDMSGKPCKSSDHIRTKVTRDMRILYLVKDLIGDQVEFTLSPPAVKVLDQLVYPTRRHVGGDDDEG